MDILWGIDNGISTACAMEWQADVWKVQKGKWRWIIELQSKTFSGQDCRWSCTGFEKTRKKAKEAAVKALTILENNNGIK